jgi:hypothetical protein
MSHFGNVAYLSLIDVLHLAGVGHLLYDITHQSSQSPLL